MNVADLRLLARRRLPRAVFDYLDGHCAFDINEVVVLSDLAAVGG